MNGFTNTFIKIITNILKLLFSALLLCTIFLCIKFFKGFDVGTIILLLIYPILIFTFYKLIKTNKIRLSYKIIFIIAVGFILRLLWLLNINTLPYSDFEVLYLAAINLVNGDNTVFQGVNYIARFPHLSYMIVYLSIIIKIFGESLVAIKIGNLIFSCISMYLIYKINLEIFDNETLALSALSIASLFAPLITYVGVLATENIAIPFYLGSIYFFILYTKNKISIKKLLISGILLGIGNLFRMVAIIPLIAYVIYIFLFTQKNILDKLKGILLLIAPYFIVLIIGSSLLRTLSITEVNLWQGKEPKSTSILKGTNINSFGRFTVEDASLPEIYNYDYDKVDSAAKLIIKERLITTPPLKLAIFYAGKFIGQWVQGDMSGVSWSESGADNIVFVMSSKAKVVFQLFYISIISLCTISLFNKKRLYNNNPIINLFYIILCGYGTTYLLTEMQGRYAYIACWLFIIFATSGLEKLFVKKL